MDQTNKDKLKQIKPRKRELVNAINWHCDTVYTRITSDTLAHWGVTTKYLENTTMKKLYEIIDKQHIDIIKYVTETRETAQTDAARLVATRREFATMQEAKTKKYTDIINKLADEALEQVRIKWINDARERDRTFLIDNADEIKIATEAIKKRAEQMNINISIVGDAEERHLIGYRGAEYILHPGGFYEVRSDEQLNSIFTRTKEDIFINKFGEAADDSSIF
jgi:hypothetical protein